MNEISFASQQVQNTTDRLKYSTYVITEVRSQMISYAGSGIGTGTVRCVHSGMNSGHSAQKCVNVWEHFQVHCYVT